MKPWWERSPERWQQEQAAFTAAGWAWAVHESRLGDGVLGVEVTYPVPQEYRGVLAPPPGSTGPTAGEEDLGVRLRVWYPPSYPYFPPVVRDAEGRLELRRHRGTHLGTLCLLHSADWHVSMTAAALLAVQMPRLLAAAIASRPPPAGWEVPAAEPLSGHLRDTGGAQVLVDTGWDLPASIDRGGLTVAFDGDPRDNFGTGVVTHLGVGDTTFEAFPARLTGQFPVTVPGRWLRWDGFDPRRDPETTWAAVEPLLNHGVQPLWGEMDNRGRGEDPVDAEVIGLLVPSEVGYRQLGEEWFFVVRHRNDPTGPWFYQLRGSTPAGAADMTSRNPATGDLADKAVLLAGVGAVGGTLARELARAGIGRLDLLDGDVCDPATACRQHAPAAFAGYAKAAVVAVGLNQTTPHVDVRAHCVTLGTVQGHLAGHSDTHHGLALLVRRADLVIDAAADPAVSRYLAALAASLDTPFLHVSATAGGHGGVVAVFPPRVGACWWCLLHHRADRTVPFPPAAPADSATVLPVGCSEPTFTGTSADLTTIAVHAARVAIDRLTPGPATERMRGSLFVAALRDHHGRPIPVRWRTRTLSVHPACPMHTLHAPSASTEHEVTPAR